MALPTWQGTGTLGSSTSSLTPNMPAGITANDILLLVVQSKVGEAVALSTANGFTECPNSPQNANVAGGTRGAAFWKRAVGSDSAPVIADPGDHIIAVMCLIRGCRTSGNPWNQTAGGENHTSAGTTATIPGFTTTINDCLIVAIDCIRLNTSTFSAWTNASLANVAEQFDQAAAPTGDSGCIGIGTGEKAGAGVVSNTTATKSASTYDAYLSFAFEPPAAAADKPLQRNIHAHRSAVVFEQSRIGYSGGWGR